LQSEPIERRHQDGFLFIGAGENALGERIVNSGRITMYRTTPLVLFAVMLAGCNREHPPG
jgi:hypothetical protein